MSSGSKITIAAFTRTGITLALRLAEFLDAEVFAPERLCIDGVKIINEPLSSWAGKFFNNTRALIFVGACGIAVRAIAEHVSSKLSDPAVIVVDEAGRFIIPILAGHIGGANELARQISGFLNAQPVITTATDINNLIAIDEWAVKNNCRIENPEAIKQVSSQILEAHSVGVAVTCENIDAPFPVTLMLRPKILILGAGCHRGIDSSEFERSAKDFLDSAGVNVLSLKALASIDIKANEPAMKDFAEVHNIDFKTFTASQLQALQGNFTSSERVLRITGADNICERACMLAAGEGAVLLRSKCAYENATFALARCKS